MDMRSAPIVLVIALATAGCLASGSNPGQDQGSDRAAPQGDAEPGGPVFDNETIEGSILLNTPGPSIGREGPEELEVAPGTNKLTLDLSWSGAQEITLRIYNRDNEICNRDPGNCPLHFVTTANGEATLLLEDPGAGTYDISFFTDDGVDSGSYAIDVQREIWPDDEPSGNANVAADKTVLMEGV